MATGTRPLGLNRVSPRVVSAVFLAIVLAVEFLGPEEYFGVHENVVVGGLLALFLAWMLLRHSVGSGVETDPETPPSVGEHYRPGRDDGESGVFRIVGAGETVTLLRVADGDGDRTHTGQIRDVDRRALSDEFEPAADPDAGFSPVRGVENLLSGLYWSVRKFL